MAQPALNPEARYPDNSRGLARQMLDLLDAIQARLATLAGLGPEGFAQLRAAAGITDPNADLIEMGIFDDLIAWMRVSDPTPWLRPVYGEAFTEVWHKRFTAATLAEAAQEAIRALVLVDPNAPVFVMPTDPPGHFNHLLAQRPFNRFTIRFLGSRRIVVMHDAGRWRFGGELFDLLNVAPTIVKSRYAELEQASVADLRFYVKQPPAPRGWFLILQALRGLSARPTVIEALLPELEETFASWPMRLRNREGLPQVATRLGKSLHVLPKTLSLFAQGGISSVILSHRSPVEAVLAHPALASVEELILLAPLLTEDLAGALARAAMPALRSLSVQTAKVSPGAVAILAAAPWASQLNGCELIASLPTFALALPLIQSAERIALPRVAIWSEAETDALRARLPMLRELQALDGASPATLFAILTHEGVLPLESLLLEGDLPEAALLALARTPTLPNLRSLTLFSSRCPRSVFQALAHSETLPKLTTLYIDTPKTQQIGAAALKIV